MKELQLYPSQSNYLNQLGSRPFMFAGVGSGKTLMALHRAHRSGARKVLVVTPPSVRDTKQWQLELDRSGLTFDEFVVQGYNFLQKYKSVDFGQFRDHFVILDEAHRIKNSQSLQGLGAFALCSVNQAGYLMLSGTPMTRWADAVNYAKITGLVRNKTEFYRRFVISVPSRYHRGMDIAGYRDEHVLMNWWKSIALRADTSKFVELPPKHDIDVVVGLDRKPYKALRDTRVAPDGTVLDNAPKLAWALRSAAERAPKKVAWIVEFLQSVDNCLIFVNTIKAIDTLSAALKRAGVGHGVWSGNKRDKFDKHDVMIVQYQAGGTGLNLQRFDSTIFMSPCYSYIDYSQAVGRTYRSGQTKRCRFYRLRAKGTIDFDIYRALDAKQDFDVNLSV